MLKMEIKQYKKAWVLGKQILFIIKLIQNVKNIKKREIIVCKIK